MKVQVVKTTNNDLPAYANPTDAGCDVRADFSSKEKVQIINGFFYDDIGEGASITLNPNGRAMIPTGLFTAIPEGYEIQVRPRSGLSWKSALTVINSPGTIDCSFKNEICILLINHGFEPVSIKHGDRIAQFVLNKFETIEWDQVEKLDGEDRGGGFGHSGTK